MTGISMRAQFPLSGMVRHLTKFDFYFIQRGCTTCLTSLLWTRRQSSPSTRCSNLSSNSPFAQGQHNVNQGSFYGSNAAYIAPGYFTKGGAYNRNQVIACRPLA
jgi:hypothetical protein